MILKPALLLSLLAVQTAALAQLPTQTPPPPVPPVAAEAPSNELPLPLFQLIEQRQYAAALPEVQRLSARKNQHATYVLATYHVCGRIVEFSCAKAAALFAESLESRNGLPVNEEVAQAAANEVAWIHATCEQPGFQPDLEIAKHYAMEAYRISQGHPFATDTLAAVVARTGDFAQAARLQRRAMAKMPELYKGEDADPQAIVQFSKRLALYEQGQGFRVTAATADENCHALPN